MRAARPRRALDLAALATELRAGRGIAHKRDIAAIARPLSLPAAPVRVGDDCAAIPDGDGYLLFAIEGFINEFVEAEPWFAGWCGVMVNVSDIYAMGGRPVGVVDALWSRNSIRAQPLLEGLAAAAKAYGVPVVGGHTNCQSPRGEQLSVAIIGRARQLLTSFDAQPGDRLVAAIDLRGRYREPHPYWDASTGAAPDGERLRGDLEILPQLAEAGLCRAAKDISMGGLAGTALMLLECSNLGAVIDVAAVPRPPGAPLARWLSSFPSYGFLLAVAHADVGAVCDRFHQRGIAAADIGLCDASGVVQLAEGSSDNPAMFWDLRQEPLLGISSAARVFA
ncbi:MAG TPA: sll0787 family AIR synthase-like protein [Stellaceae bacterium]|jgi:AIR synthase-related protein|nr:sll0787 family AIR synthase-like protein [Stellaceae bacterium]